jgi:hypothetical protein
MDKSIIEKLQSLYPVTRAGLSWNESMREVEQAMGYEDRGRENYVREPDTIEHRIAA